MQRLTPSGQHLVNDLSQRYNLSFDAVLHMLIAVNNGGGTMAQFNCPELGGSGQWMQGGMTMVGDMFNHGLKMTVDNLCNELANGLASTQVFPPAPRGSSSGNQWWPAELGSPSSSGAQNNIRYAVFPNRLAVELNGQITIYDTLDHQISGVSQQQGGDTSLTFSSQYGTVSVTSLPVISGPGIAPAPRTNFAEPFQDSANHPPAQSAQNESTVQSVESVQSAYQNSQPNTESPGPDKPIGPAPSMADSSVEILALIEKLGSLKEAGILTEDEFNTKKSELLERL